MGKYIRESIRDNMLDAIKNALSEEERYKAIINFQEFVRALIIEADTESVDH